MSVGSLCLLRQGHGGCQACSCIGCGWGPWVCRKLKHREGPLAPRVLSRTQPVGSQLAALYFSNEAKKGVESEKKEKMVCELKG